MKYRVSGLAASVFLLIPAIATAADEWIPLTTEEFKEKVVGNTLEGMDGSNAYKETYAKNGQVYGVWNYTRRYVARWRVPQESQECPTIEYRSQRGWNCLILLENNGEYMWRTHEGREAITELVSD